MSYDYGRLSPKENIFSAKNSFNNYLNIPSLSNSDLPLVKPSDPTIPTLSGQFVANDIWLQVEKPLDHVFKLKFKTPQVLR